MTALDDKDNSETNLAQVNTEAILKDLNTLINETDEDDSLELSGRLTQEFADALEKNDDLLRNLRDKVNKIKDSSTLQEEIKDLYGFLCNIVNKIYISQWKKDQTPRIEENRSIDTEIQEMKSEMDLEANLSFTNPTDIVYYYNGDGRESRIRDDFGNLAREIGNLPENVIPQNVLKNIKTLAGVVEPVANTSSIINTGNVIRHRGDVGAIQAFLLNNKQVVGKLQEELGFSEEKIQEKLGDGKYGMVTWKGLEIYYHLIADNIQKIKGKIEEKSKIDSFLVVGENGAGEEIMTGENDDAEVDPTTIITKADEMISETNSNIKTITDKYKKVPETTPELSLDAKILLNKFPEELKNDNDTRENIKNVITNLTGLRTDNVKNFIDDIYDPFYKKAYKIIDKINALPDDEYHDANENKLLNKLVKVVRKGLVENIKNYIKDYIDTNIKSSLIGYSFKQLYSEYNKFTSQSDDVQKITLEGENKELRKGILERHNNLEQAGIHFTGPADEPEIEFKGELKDLLYKSYDANNQQRTAGDDSVD